MQGSASLTAVRAAPAPPAYRVLADVALWFEQHQDDAPPLGDRTVSLQVTGHSHAEKMAALSAIAKFLGADMVPRNEVWFVQRRFGEPGNSVTLEAHYTPDHDAAFARLKELAAGRDAGKVTAA